MTLYIALVATVASSLAGSIFGAATETLLLCRPTLTKGE